jgi:hypothetical protein
MLIPSLVACRKPPYEVTEDGWGEFVVTIILTFRDDALPPLKKYYNLRLLPQEELNSSKCAFFIASHLFHLSRHFIVSIFCSIGRTKLYPLYDEVLFFDPSAELREKLAKSGLPISPPGIDESLSFLISHGDHLFPWIPHFLP